MSYDVRFATHSLTSTWEHVDASTPQLAAELFVARSLLSPRNTAVRLEGEHQVEVQSGNCRQRFRVEYSVAFTARPR